MLSFLMALVGGLFMFGLGLSLIPALVIFPTLGGAEMVLLLVTFFLVFLLGGVILQTIFQPAIWGAAIAHERGPGVGASLASSLRSFPRFFLLFVLHSLVTIGGMVLFVVPGLVAAVYLVMALPIAIEDKVSGMEALRRSTALVRGRWFAVCGRVSLILLVMLGVSIGATILDVIFALVVPSEWGPFTIVSRIIANAYLFAYLTALYEGLRTSTQSEKQSSGRTATVVYASLASVAILLLGGFTALLWYSAPIIQKFALESAAELENLEDLYLSKDASFPEGNIEENRMNVFDDNSNVDDLELPVF